MIVRIRFGRGPLVTDRRGKNGKAARLLGSLLTLVAISFGVLGVWRLCGDLGFAGDFVIATGLFSHWQVWIAMAAALQYASWRLTKYARGPRENGSFDNVIDEDDESFVSAAAPRKVRRDPEEKLTARV